MNRYPYFIYPLVNELKFCTDPDRCEELRALIAANVGDPEALAALIGNIDFDPRTFYPSGHDADLSTDDTIENFIAKFSPKRDFDIETNILTQEETGDEEAG